MNGRTFGDIARRLADGGYLPVPIKPGTKHPPMAGWPTFRLTNGVPGEFRSYGTGLLCGQPADGGMIVVGADIDILDEAAAAELHELALLRLGDSPARIGMAPKVLIPYRASAPFKKFVTASYRIGDHVDRDGKPFGHRVEVLGKGQQFVAFAVHPDTGRPYFWPAGDLLTTPLADLPEVTEGQLRAFLAEAEDVLARYGERLNPAEPPPLPPRDDARSGRTSDAYVEAALANEQRNVATRPHPGRNEQLNASAFALGHYVGGGHLDRARVERKLEDAAHDCGLVRDEGIAKARATIRSGLEKGMRKPKDPPERWAETSSAQQRQERQSNQQDTPAGDASTHASTHAGGASGVTDVAKYKEDWYNRAMLGTRGNVLSNVGNSLLALREDRRWHGRLSYNAFTQTHLIDGRPLRDCDVVDFQEWAQIAGLTAVSTTTSHTAVTKVCDENAFHPIVAFLDGLLWDGTPRIDHWLARYAGAEESAYIRAVGRMTLIQMVARVRSPGCKADHTPILEGPQGIGKSTLCKTLAGGDEYFSDSLPQDVGKKDAMAHLPGKWVIELAELSAMDKSELSTLKAFVTKCEDRYRPAYGRMEVTAKRQCIFIGTTNHAVYLRDETGNRRYWPVKCGKLGLAALSRDRDQLLAEADAAYRGGAEWWPSPDFERVHVLPEQASKFDADVWEEAIEPWLRVHDRVTVSQVAKEALELVVNKVGRREQNRIIAILQTLGFIRERNHGVRWWVKP